MCILHEQNVHQQKHTVLVHYSTYAVFSTFIGCNIDNSDVYRSAQQLSWLHHNAKVILMRIQ